MTRPAAKNRKLRARGRAGRLVDGTRVHLRPIRPSDKSMLQDGVARLSLETRYNRFMTAIKAFTPEQLAYLTEVDQVDHIAWVALIDGRGVGVARCIRDRRDRNVAEAAIVVCDDWQGRGVGRLLGEALRDVALKQGITRVRGEVRSDNQRILGLVSHFDGAVVGAAAGPEVLTVDVPLRPAARPDAAASRHR